MSLGVIPARSQTQTPLPEVQYANPYIHHLESNSPRRLCDPLQQYDFIISAVIPHY